MSPWCSVSSLTVIFILSHSHETNERSNQPLNTSYKSIKEMLKRRTALCLLAVCVSVWNDICLNMSPSSSSSSSLNKSTTSLGPKQQTTPHLGILAYGNSHDALDRGVIPTWCSTNNLNTTTGCGRWGAAHYGAVLAVEYVLDGVRQRE